MTSTTARPTRQDRLDEARRYYRNGKEADRLFFAGVGADEDGRYRVEGRFAHEWLSLAWSVGRHYGFTRDEITR